MTPRRLLVAVPAALVAAAAALLLPAGAATAAAGPIPPGCGALDVTDTPAVAANAEGVSDVFLGRVVRLDRVRVNPGTSAGASAGASTGATEAPVTQDLVYNVLVDVPITGDLAADQRVTVVLEEVEAGDEPLRRSRRYLFFASGEGSSLRADGCDGYASATMVDATTLQEIRTALTAEPETPDVVLTKPEGSDGPPDLGRVVAPGAAVSLIGVLGLLLVSRVGRNRS